MMNAEQTPNQKKEYTVTLYLDDKQVMEKTVNQFFYIILKRVKAWCAEKIRSGHRAGYNIQEVRRWSTSAQVPSRVVESEVSVMKLFLDKDKQCQLKQLFLAYKALYESYEKGSLWAIRLRVKIYEMYGRIESEFYHTADVCQNTIWQWQDYLDNFPRTGCLLCSYPHIEDLYDSLNLAETESEKRRIQSSISAWWKHQKESPFFDPWRELLSSWHNRQRVISILQLVKDFNLDNQDSALVNMFKTDFMCASTDKQFASALIKWNDLILWSPWKQELYRDCCPLPANSHWEDEYNPDFNDNSEEEV